MDYRQTLDYLYSRLPMFTRIGPAAFKKDLTNTIAFCTWLGDPQLQFKSVHIAGTNGKGSTSHMLAAVLQSAGYKTGLYTSPHLKDFRERIRINGEMISEEEIVQFVEKSRDLIEQIEPSFFETTVAMAFDHFARHKIDIAVIEVGLGGRLDSTNIITPILSIITNISFDHMNMLGNTLQEIAVEKAGIIKQAIPVIIGERDEDTAGIFIDTAEKAMAPILFASDEWEVIPLKESKETGIVTLEAVHTGDHTKLRISCGLTGSYQEKNIKTVLSGIRQLKLQGYKVPHNKLLAGLLQVRELTGFAGRWQVLGERPLVICDTGHNEAGIKEVMESIRNVPFLQLHIVIGMVKDKDIAKILQLLPRDARYYFCSPSIERALPADDLEREALNHRLIGKAYPAVTVALDAAKNAAGSGDLIFVGGSTFVVAEII